MILILGGTGEARALAAALARAGRPVLSSLAGRVSAPARPVGDVRIGGFGGTEGLVRFLADHGVTALVDATHPFAATMSGHAIAASAQAGVPLVRLERPGWHEHRDAGSWTWVADAAAAVAAGSPSQRPFLTTGRQSIGEYAAWADRDVLVRVVDPPTVRIPDRWTIITARGPYAVAGELALMRNHRADLLVTKDSGGALTEAKLTAAHELNVPVVVLQRPVVTGGPPPVSSIEAAVAVIREST